MTMIEVEEEELNALRSLAASAIPWKNEAERLASALYDERPAHPLLKGEIWEDLCTRKLKGPQFTSETGVLGAAIRYVTREDVHVNFDDEV